jgi:putative ABC transport system permease protein
MELLNEIWQTARRNKLRTALTGFAVAWGIFMLIVLLGAGNGLINAQMEQSDRFLSSSMVVFGGQTSKPYNGLQEGRNIRLQQRDIKTTGEEFTGVIDNVGAQYRTAATISLGQQYISSQIAGVYPNHTQIDKVQMLYGRFINDIDIREKRKVLVLSNKQAAELASPSATIVSGRSNEAPSGAVGGAGASLIGRFVNVGSFAFKVVGIYKENENGRADAFSSYTAIKGIYGANTDDAGRIEFTFHGLTTEEANEAFEADYRARLNASHQAAPDDESAVWLWNRYTQNLQMETGIGIIRTALWIIGLLTLLSGIVGVSNIMLITVKERTHEFGIRKAIGAKPWSILRLIIVESIIITTLFGYVGMLLGIGANEWMNATIGHTKVDAGLFKAAMFVNPTVGIDVCIEATLVMVVAGTVAGLIPAMKASRIRPIEALRAE